MSKLQICNSQINNTFGIEDISEDGVSMYDNDFLSFFHQIPFPSNKPPPISSSPSPNQINIQKTTKIIHKKQKIIHKCEIVQFDNLNNTNGTRH